MKNILSTETTCCDESLQTSNDSKLNQHIFEDSNQTSLLSKEMNRIPAFSEDSTTDNHTSSSAKTLFNWTLEEDSDEEESDDEELYHEPDLIDDQTYSSPSSTPSTPIKINHNNDQTVDSDSRSSSQNSLSNSIEDIKEVPSTVDGEVKEKAKRKRRRGKRKTKAQKEALAKEREAAALLANGDSSSTTSPFASNVSSTNSTPTKNQPKKTSTATTPTKDNSKQQNNSKKNQNIKSPLKPQTSSLIGKAGLVSPPKRYSHSALRLHNDDSNDDHSSTGSIIKPIRQPFGPTIGNNNGFSSEYQKSRRLAIQKSKNMNNIK